MKGFVYMNKIQHDYDGLIDAFDMRWRSGTRPDLFEYVESASESDRASLLRCLIPIDIEYRVRAGEVVESSSYIHHGDLAVEIASGELRHRCSTSRDSVDAKGLYSTISLPEKESPTSLSYKRFEMGMPDRIGDYRILNLIAEHGQGSIYRADHIHLNRQVAIKVCKNRVDPNGEQAIMQEGRLLASLSHPNIAKIYDLTIVSGKPHLIMEYIEGQNLDDAYRGVAIPSLDAAVLVKAIARAMEYAHSNGVIHCDLKPANVVLRSSDKTPQVIDFGLARVRHALAVEEGSGSYGGTFCYMAPEQARAIFDVQHGSSPHVEPDTRSDIFSLGAVLFTLLTGKRLYEAESNLRRIEKAIRCDFDLSPLNSKAIPKFLRTACLKALSVNPADRFQTASAFAESLNTPARIPWKRLIASFVFVCVFSAIAYTYFASLPLKVELNAMHFTEDDARPLQRQMVHEHDKLRLDATFTSPARCMLFALNPNREFQLCYPDAQLEQSNVALKELHFPARANQGFSFTDGPGQQGFFLLVSPNPLPSFEAVKKELIGFEEKLANVAGRYQWEDGWLRSLDTVGKVRGATSNIEGVQGFAEFCEKCQTIVPDSQIYAITFPVAPVANP